MALVDVRRSRRRRRVAVGLLVAALLAAAAWIPLGSPWLRVDTVTVTGTDRLPRERVESVASPERGRPMLLVDGARIRRALAGDPLVRAVTVRRAWPATLRVSVTERVAAVAVPGGSGFRLVAEDGVVVGEAARVPGGLPTLQVDLLTGGPDAVRSGLTVLRTLPGDLRRVVERAGADSADGVWLALTDGATVRWGGPEDGARKAAVVRRLRAVRHGKATHGVVYDVTAPLAPAVGRGVGRHAEPGR